MINMTSQIKPTLSAAPTAVSEVAAYANIARLLAKTSFTAAEGAAAAPVLSQFVSKLPGSRQKDALVDMLKTLASSGLDETDTSQFKELLAQAPKPVISTTPTSVAAPAATPAPTTAAAPAHTAVPTPSARTI